VTFPADRDGKRRALLDGVDRVRAVLIAGADQAETSATLPAATVDALGRAGLFRLKLPAMLGGAEADPVTQIDVLEALARIDAAAAWCVMVGATTVALPGAFLPDEAIAKIFAGGQVPRAAGVIMPTGTAVRVDGGYRVRGRWSFASGIKHADWVGAVAMLQAPVGRGATDAGRAERLNVVVPVAHVEIHENWQVAGLRGTGSCDFSLTDVFVPEPFAWSLDHAGPRRGGALYRLGLPAFVANEHAAFALGLGRRALDTIVGLAPSTRRGPRGTSVAERPAFQRALGECDLRLRAARALVVELNEEAWSTVSAGRPITPELHAVLRSASTLATDVAIEAVTTAFRHAGGAALYETNVLQRCLRDMYAAAQHFMVSDSAYEAHGRSVLGRAGDPMV
jgi:alkylation response protein AidB-like acyl-CoA dehydrogenase